MLKLQTPTATPVTMCLEIIAQIHHLCSIHGCEETASYIIMSAKDKQLEMEIHQHSLMFLLFPRAMPILVSE
jgi:hypothetical protein